MTTFDKIVLGFFAFAAVGGVIDLGWFLLTASPSGSGSRAPHSAASRLRRSGFDPSRKEAE